MAPAPDDDPTLAALIAELEAHEAELVLPRFTNDDAWALGSWLWTTAAQRGLAVTIDVQRGDQRLFHAARPGTAADNDAWIERKVQVVRRFGSSSYLVGRRLQRSGDTIEGVGLDPARYAAHGGCFPVLVAGVGMVGTVTVSGLAQADDHALVVEALRALR